MKDPKHKMMLLPKPNVQKLILDFKNHLQRLGVLLNFTQKNAPPTLSHGEGRWGLRSKINEGIATKKMKKKPHPSSPLERMGGAINYKGSLIYHLHLFGHEVQHPYLYFLPLALE